MCRGSARSQLFFLEKAMVTLCALPLLLTLVAPYRGPPFEVHCGPSPCTPVPLPALGLLKERHMQNHTNMAGQHAAEAAAVLT